MEKKKKNGTKTWIKWPLCNIRSKILKVGGVVGGFKIVYMDSNTIVESKSYFTTRFVRFCSPVRVEFLSQAFFFACYGKVVVLSLLVMATQFPYNT